MAFGDLFSCRGKVALVTGAASGLGFMFAQTMAEAGADVACADKDAGGLAEVVEAVKANGRRAIAIPCELALCYAPYGINVNAICPGFIKTKIGNSCSDASSYMCGDCIAIDGGYLAG